MEHPSRAQAALAIQSSNTMSQSLETSTSIESHEDFSQLPELSEDEPYLQPPTSAKEELIRRVMGTPTVHAGSSTACDDPSGQLNLPTVEHPAPTMRSTPHSVGSDGPVSHSSQLGVPRGSGDIAEEESRGAVSSSGFNERVLLDSSHALMHAGDPATSPLAFHGKIGRCDTKVIIDSGATLNFVSQAFIHKHKFKAATIKDGPTVVLADGTSHRCERVLPKASLKIGPYQATLERLFILPLHVKYDVILGKPWLHEANPTIDWATNTVNLQNRGHRVTLHPDYDYSSPPEELGLLSANE